MIEHTYSIEYIVVIIRTSFVFKSSESVRHSIPQSADSKRNFNLSHILYLSILIILFKWMDDCVFKVSFDLPIILFEIIEVMVEWKHLLNVFVSLISLGFDLALFYFFLLSIILMIVNAQRIDRLSDFKVWQLSIDLKDCFVDR